MNILVTGAKGFVGKNLIEALKNIRDRKDRTRPDLQINTIFEFDVNIGNEKLEEFCEEADFVFHLAGVNRPKSESEFMSGNFGLTSELINLLEKSGKKVPVMFASSIQAFMIGRYKNSEYGRSKKAAEDLLLEYGKKTDSAIYIYRFPNLFGKWCRPNYNSVVATFCNAFANDLPYQVNDETTELELLYIDDLVDGLLDALEGKENRCNYIGTNPVANVNGKFCHIYTTYKVTLGKIISELKCFAEQPVTLMMPKLVPESFEKKLFATYLSYLPKEKVVAPLQMKTDERGSFTEILKTVNAGQFSVNISKPGITKGQHWHNSKWEIFFVVSGHALIQERKIGVDEQGNAFEMIEFEVSGDCLEAVYMLPGYTHNIINLSMTENLVTVMWANESFDKEKPDTYYEEV